MNTGVRAVLARARRTAAQRRRRRGVALIKRGNSYIFVIWIDAAQFIPQFNENLGRLRWDYYKFLQTKSCAAISAVPIGK